jgi:hypothetical protein
MRHAIIYLLTGFVTMLGATALIIYAAARRAIEGFEDETGFRPGALPVVVPPPTSALAAPAGEVAKPKRRRSNSRPPMPISTQAVVDSNPPFPRKSRRKKTADSNPPIPLDNQTVFPNIVGQVSMQ